MTPGLPNDTFGPYTGCGTPWKRRRRGHEVLGEIDIVIDAHTRPRCASPISWSAHHCSWDHLDAAHMLLAVEVITGNRRIDRVMKRSEYADAGITHYWIVDLTDHA